MANVLLFIHKLVQSVSHRKLLWSWDIAHVSYGLLYDAFFKLEIVSPH